MISDGTEHKESLDRFSSYLKGRLENHQSPVDTESWDKISDHLKRRKRIRLGWISTGIAAAILLAILWLSVPFEMETVQEQIAKQEIPLQHKEDVPVPETTAPVTETLAINTPVTTPILPTATEVKEPAEEIEEEAVESNPLQEEGEYQIKDEPQPEVREQAKSQKDEPFLPFEQEPFDFAELPQKKKGSKWLLAVAMGTGGGDASMDFSSSKDYASLNTSNESEYPNTHIPSVPTDMEGNYVNDKEYSDISHAIPISVGITVRKEINQIFAVESGLLYTYLSSDLKKNRVSKNDKLQLHYLGIPINMVGYMVNKPQWNMYISGGVMFEKGLKSVLTIREYGSNDIVSTTEKNSISGIQISLNGAVGIAYRLFDHWSLYAEPKIYYYFDTDQPPSTRTEHPFGFGVNGGIRYHF